MATFIICKTAPKLKHLALWQIYYQLIHTCLIFTYNSWNYCNCYKFSGCQLRLSHPRLGDKRNYCFVCQVRVTHNIDKTDKLQQILDVFNTYLQLKEDLKLCIDFGCKRFRFYDFKTNGKRKFSKTYNNCLQNFLNNGYYNVCYYNP